MTEIETAGVPEEDEQAGGTLAKQLATSQRFYQRASAILISVVGAHFKAR